MGIRMMLGACVLLLIVNLSGFALAETFDGTLKKIDGSVYVVKDNRNGIERRIVSNQSTVKIGELKEGAPVEVEVDDASGYAKVIKAKKS
ncbi:MAG TPA: hypothetical protein VLY45_01540 [Nitrospiria bacterium]|nr:hypothetical protein [Nitrospiria bacterium]